MNMVEFEQFEHKADIGVRGYGKNIEEAFENGARAMFSVMVNLKKVEMRKEVKIECEAAKKLIEKSGQTGVPVIEIDEK
jgi:SHS2 domain-containing protein